MTLKFNSALEVVQIHVHAKLHQTECSGSWVIVSTSFFVLSRNGEKIRKSGPCDVDLWHVTLKFSGFLRLSWDMLFMQNFIEVSG